MSRILDDDDLDTAASHRLALTPPAVGPPIAGCVEEQHATTQEITHSVQAVVSNEETVENNLTLLRQAAHNTSSLVETVRTSVDQLGETTQGLESAVSDLTA